MKSSSDPKIGIRPTIGGHLGDSDGTPVGHARKVQALGMRWVPST